MNEHKDQVLPVVSTCLGHGVDCLTRAWLRNPHRIVAKL